MTPEEIVADLYESRFNLVDEKAVSDLIAKIKSALTARTEQCAQSVESLWIDGAGFIGPRVAAKIRALNQPSPVSEPKEEAEESAKKKSQCRNVRSDYGCQAVEGHSHDHVFGVSPLPTIDAPDRIALLTQLIGEQQIKIAQLEKERHEITQKLEASYRHVCASYCDECKSPNNRKA